MLSKLGRQSIAYSVTTSKPDSQTSSISAQDLADYFEKINGIWVMTEGAGSPCYESNTSGLELPSFMQLSIADIVQFVQQAPMKQCSLDPVLTWLLKDCIV